MLINVTQSHIEAGTPSECESCPVALAICEAMHLRAGDVAVSEFEIELPGRVVITTPAVVKAFVHDFDLTGDVAPFAFELPTEGA